MAVCDAFRPQNGATGNNAVPHERVVAESEKSVLLSQFLLDNALIVGELCLKDRGSVSRPSDYCPRRAENPVGSITPKPAFRPRAGQCVCY
jgi:hypothetical protein